MPGQPPRFVKSPRASRADASERSRLLAIALAKTSDYTGFHMPMLADLDDPPRSQWPGILRGLLIAAPVVIGVAVWGLPQAHAIIMQGANKADERIELEAAYMQGLCTDAIVLGRDERLCKCVLGSQAPGIDCQGPFVTWTLARQIEQCASAEAAQAALSFCSCVNTLRDDLQALPRLPANEEARRAIVSNYAHCGKLDDALYLPELSPLKRARQVCRKKGPLPGYEAYCQCKDARERELAALPDTTADAFDRASVVDRFGECAELYRQARTAAALAPSGDNAPLGNVTPDEAPSVAVEEPPSLPLDQVAELDDGGDKSP